MAEGQVADTNGRPEVEEAEAEKVVIVGAGPAGLLAAILLVKQGYTVEVYERGQSPREMSVEEKRRTILFGITARGQDALREAGIALPDAGWLHGLAVGRTTFVHNYPKRKLKTNSKNIMFAERAALVDHLTSQARQLAPPGKLTFFYKHFLTDVKVKRKVCTFVGPEGMVDASFHLLIGADGVWSAVREQLQRFDPDLEVVVVPSGQSYKAFQGLSPMVEGEWKMTAGDGADLHSMFGRRSRWTLAVWPTRENLVAGVLTGDSTAITRLRNAADFGETILTNFPTFPRKWVLPIAQQLAATPARAFGASVRCSRLHGTGIALLGDAAHGVTPYLGQGCNAALESAALLAQALKEGNGNVEAGLERYTQMRLGDAHALHTLDLQARTRLGLNGNWQPRYLGTLLHILFWMLVSCVTFGRAEQPYLDALMGRASYAKTLRALQRDDAVWAGLLILASLGGLYMAGLGICRLVPQADFRFLLQDGILGALVLAGVTIVVFLKGLSRVA